MPIVLKNVAKVYVPEEYRAEVLGMYRHVGRDGSMVQNYKYKEGVAYLPLNYEKLNRVADLLGVEIIDKRSHGEALTEPFELENAFKFRPHQEAPSMAFLTHCLMKNYGVLSAECGAGKTVMMSWVAGKLGHKVLIIIDMVSLGVQWAEAMKAVWNKEVQIINKDASKFEDVCVVTFQLLHCNPELLARIKVEFGTLVLDEAHSTGSDTRREILFRLDNKYRIACSATYYRKGWTDEVLTDFVSDVSVTVKDGSSMKPSVVFIPTTSRFYSNDPQDWGKTISKLGKDLPRNKFIADLIISKAKEGRRILVVGVTIEGLRSIMFHLGEVEECRATLFVGSTTASQDMALRNDVADGSINVVMTIKKLDKGVDIPSLDCLILVRPANNQAFVQQIAGRIVRSLPDKSEPIILDLVDDCDLAKTFAKNRGRWYKNLGYSIKGEL